MVAYGYSVGYYGKFFYNRMSASPDNFPAAVETVEEWAYTDNQNETWLALRFRNNGVNTVVFRPKRLQAPPGFVVGPGE